MYPSARCKSAQQEAGRGAAITGQLTPAPLCVLLFAWSGWLFASYDPR